MSSQTCYQSKTQNSKTNPQMVAIMVPFPMQGHLNEALHLSHLINSYGIPVHYVGYTPYNHQAKLRLHGRDTENLSKIHFHDLQLPTLNSIPPNQEGQIKFHEHLQPLFDASLSLRQPMFQLLKELSSKYTRIVVIHDTLMAFAVQDVKLIPNAEAFALHTVSAFTIFFYMWESLNEKPFQLDSNIPKYIPSNEGCFTPEFADFVAKQHKILNFESGRLYNTSRLIEGKYMDLLGELPVNLKKRLFAVGPLNPVQIKPGNKDNKHRCLDWLDKQEVNSVIYVSFGTATTMTDDQIRELASGLEKSGQKFIWVLRDADKFGAFGQVESPRLLPQLPEGYEERVRKKGLVIREWAPQLEILAHPSTGGFLSHCGWNSCMESISMGVPIAAWPMHYDQPKNSVLVTQVLGIGTLVRDWGDRTNVIASTTIENVVVKLMMSEEGREIRRRAAELGRRVQESVAKGGSSRLEVDNFIAHITR
ncbi:hypothetical protein RND81_12G006600 [Saponaria officinalis]|uniref:Glycosyltransferase n=1 Tax=Saponaria officinalis TaxID=3572 RepID=A0AAW1H6Z4_SAPOF